MKKDVNWIRLTFCYVTTTRRLFKCGPLERTSVASPVAQSLEFIVYSQYWKALTLTFNANFGHFKNAHRSNNRGYLCLKSVQMKISHNG